MNENKIENDVHELMPDSIAKTTPDLFTAEKQKDQVAYVKWFMPDDSRIWYVLEYGPKDRICLCFVEDHQREIALVSLDRVRQRRGPEGHRVERDVAFSPTPVRDLYQELDRGR